VLQPLESSGFAVSMSMTMLMWFWHKCVTTVFPRSLKLTCRGWSHSRRCFGWCDWVQSPAIGRFVAVVEPTGNRRADPLADVLAPASFPLWFYEMTDLAAKTRGAVGLGRSGFGAVNVAMVAVLGHDRLIAHTLGGWFPCGWSAYGGSSLGTATGYVWRAVVWVGVEEAAVTAVALDHVVGSESNVMPASRTFELKTMIVTKVWLGVLTHEICESRGPRHAVGGSACGRPACLKRFLRCSRTTAR
jgi:hypothetical protein